MSGYTVTFRRGIAEVGMKNWDNRVITTKLDAFAFARESAFVTGHAEVRSNRLNSADKEWYFDRDDDGKPFPIVRCVEM